MGDRSGELEYESFNAASAIVNIQVKMFTLEQQKIRWLMH